MLLTERWTYNEVVVSDMDAERHCECAVQWEARTRYQDILTAVRQHRYSQIDGARTSTGQYDVLHGGPKSKSPHFATHNSVKHW